MKYCPAFATPEKWFIHVYIYDITLGTVVYINKNKRICV
ncbi:hypothetical protein MuYL_4359 [Mucilaginibacter xinganensis]|uniref:Uncharacterized protein n=1 Tax=Mucilaginibacter xinganensis TaxID=1234841 RepID=A0A223P2R0_9SPHI|nr:hypothetical protein MuYL_4359 [Mucilaginibacter xinganensis]